MSVENKKTLDAYQKTASIYLANTISREYNIILNINKNVIINILTCSSISVISKSWTKYSMTEGIKQIKQITSINKANKWLKI